jgi:hypothetical protein
MNTTEKLQAILEIEIGRLHAASKASPLDMADICRLEKLIAAHAKSRPLVESDKQMEGLTTEDLLNVINSDSEE